MRKSIIIISILLISILLVSGCIGQQPQQQNIVTKEQIIDDKNTTDPQSKYYDGFDSSLDELDALEQS